ncbi:MAG TPA: T9SS type A sorting domain-containing protein [Candidatus Kapabacteria bacterium]|jgi:photosystem II stability/assembly factor-like uncharacterized protein|nr:T9SS type A sorting domain-containing protein [Candidatus Kapabacteria bacterium]
MDLQISRYTFAAIAALIVLTTSGASAQLVALTAPSASQQELVQFLNGSTGYLVSSTTGCPSVPGGRYALYRTNDGGRTWASLSGCDTTPIRRFRGLQMLDTTHGYALFEGSPLRRVFARTVDGGRTWLFVDSTIALTFRFIDSLEGFRQIDLNDRAPTLERTSDGGRTWTTIDTTVTDLWRVQFPTPTVGYAQALMPPSPTDHGQRLARTTDRGRSWTSLSLAMFTLEHTSGLVLTMHRPHFPSAAVGFGFSQGSVYRTSDSGATWTKLPGSIETALNARMPIEFRDIKFADEMNGYFVGVCYDFGEDMSLGKTFVIRTTDGGASWSALRYNGKRNLVDAYSASINAYGGVAYVAIDAAGGPNRIYKHECVLRAEGFDTPGPIRFKQGDSATIVAREGIAYEWSTGASNRQITVRYSGRYAVRVTLPDFCVLYDTMSVTVDPMVRAVALVERKCYMDCDGVGVRASIARAVIAGECNQRLSIHEYALPTLSVAHMTELSGYTAPHVRSALYDRDGSLYMLVQIDTFSAKLVKHTPDGRIAWERDFPNLSTQSAYLLALDAWDRPIIALAQWEPVFQALAPVVMRFTRGGELDFRKAFQIEVGSTVRPAALRVRDDGSVLALIKLNRDMVLLEYAPDGTPLTPVTYGHSNNSSEVAYGMSLGTDGDVVASCLSYTDADTLAVVVALRRGGGVRWTHVERHTSPTIDHPRAYALADGGAIVVRHGRKQHGDSLIPSVTRLTPDGSIAWRRCAKGDTSDYQSLRFLQSISASQVDDRGNTYVSGPEPIYANYPDAFWTMCLDADGNKRWEIYNDKAGVPESIKVDESGSVYVAALRAFWGPGCLLQRLEQPGWTASASPSERAAPKTVLVTWPSPAREALSLRFPIAENCSIGISLIDMAGRTVVSQDLGLRATGELTAVLDIRGLPTGTYVVRVNAGSIVHTSPVVVEGVAK